MSLHTIEKCYPNAHGWLKLLEGRGDDEGYWFVREPDAQDRDDYSEFESLEDARKYYEERKTVWANEPNWKAQEEYDEKHGTINGYAPWQYNREE